VKNNLKKEFVNHGIWTRCLFHSIPPPWPLDHCVIRRVGRVARWEQTGERTWNIFQFLPFYRSNDNLKISAPFILNLKIRRFSRESDHWNLKKTVVGKIQTMTLVFGPRSENDWNIQYTWFSSSEISVYWNFIGVPKPLKMYYRERLGEFSQLWILCNKYCDR